MTTEFKCILKLLLAEFLIDNFQIVKIEEITLDMAYTMVNICSNFFPNDQQVTDRFYVRKLATEAVQNIRIKYRWKVLELGIKNYKQAKKACVAYIPEILENGGTLKQLLVRSRYLLFKHYSKWTEKQKERAQLLLLFEKYSKIQQAYN